MGKNHNDLIGHLSNYRCPDCGCTLYVNAVGSAWCSDGCGYDDTFDAEKLVHLPPPEHIRERDAQLRILTGDDEGE